MSRSTVSRPPSETAIPADSWPRCCSAKSAKYESRATSRSTDRIPKTPHILELTLPDGPEVAAAGRRGSRRRRPRRSAARRRPSRADRSRPARPAARGSPGRTPRRTASRGSSARSSSAPTPDAAQPRRARRRGRRRRRRARASSAARRRRRADRAPPRPRGRASAACRRRCRSAPGARSPGSAGVPAEASRITSPGCQRTGDAANVGHETRRSRRPASDGSSGRRCRCRARRCRRRSAAPSASHACAIPSIDSASSHPISGFSGLPKLRQSVKPSGSPPAQATLRAASRIASAPPVNGSSEPTRPVPSSVSGEPAVGRPQPQHGGVEPRPAHGARLDELVVAPVHERARAERVRAEQLEQHVAGRRQRRQRRSRRSAGAARCFDHVARAVLGQVPGRNRARRPRRPRAPAAHPSRSPRRSRRGGAPSGRSPPRPRRAARARRSRPSAPATRRS